MAKQLSEQSQLQVIPTYICNQERRITEMEHTITELYKIITGNGTPANGMVSQIINIAAEQKNTNSSLTRIETTLAKQDVESDKVKAVAYKTANELHVHIAESVGEINQKGSYFKNWQIAIMVLALFVTLIIGLLNLSKGNKIEDDVEHNAVRIENQK